MRRILVILVALTLMLAFSTVDADAGYKRAKRMDPAATLMIGDSTTQRVAEEVLSRHPDWTVDGVGGRPVTALTVRLDAYLANNPAPGTFIMALGTNHGDNWSYERLYNAIDRLPASTDVFLMKVVRAGDFQADKDADRQIYNGYSRRLINERPNTYFIPWRDRVLNDPTLDKHTGLSSLLEDGTHQTGSKFGTMTPGPGVKTYVNLIDNAIATKG